MKKLFAAPLLIASFIVGTSCNQGGNKSSDSKEVAEEKNEQKFDDTKIEDDTKFLVEAASGGLMEVELGKLAQQNASSPKVKEFGSTMVTDHSKANDELKALAAKKNITIPTAPADKHKEHIDDLSKKKGADFDKAYIDLMVDDHEEDVSKFKKEADEGKDPEIKAFASGKVTTLQHHYDMAKTIKDAMKQ